MESENSLHELHNCGHTITAFGEMLRFSKILVANRGEIASRIIRTTKRMGIQSLVVCNPIDMNARYVQEVGSGILRLQ